MFHFKGKELCNNPRPQRVRRTDLSLWCRLEGLGETCQPLIWCDLYETAKSGVSSPCVQSGHQDLACQRVTVIIQDYLKHKLPTKC